MANDQPSEVTEYPKYIYHRDYGAKIVGSAEDHATHDGNWVESPAGFPKHPDNQPLAADVFGSGSDWYGAHWDSGFAGEGDPYGIKSEYVAQSASPNAVPTQEQADAAVAQGN